LVHGEDSGTLYRAHGRGGPTDEALVNRKYIAVMVYPNDGGKRNLLKTVFRISSGGNQANEGLLPLQSQKRKD
jgi:hypothetical protein